MDLKKYWIVQSFGEEGHHYGRTYYRHPSRESADQEAKRLAAKVGRPFTVLETVSCFRPPTPEVEEVKLD